MYDYKSADSRDLSFVAGDVITVHCGKSNDEDWWMGHIGDRSGMFPANYVTPLHSHMVCQQSCLLFVDNCLLDRHTDRQTDTER